MKSINLCRVSSKEQEETGYSLPAQEKLLNAYAEKHGFSVAKNFSISESASGRKQREIFNDMMTYVNREGIKLIIIEKVDRLTRNFKDAVMVDEWLEADEERQVHFVKDGLVLHRNSRSQEKLNWGIRILFAKNYIDNLSEEVKKGQKEKIAQGWLPCRPPYGYTTIGEKGHKTHIPDIATMPIAKKMFEWYATGNYSLKMLTDMLYEVGMRSAGGNKIGKSRIHEYLTDPFYIGKVRWNNQITTGNQEIYIDPEIFERVQATLKGKTTPKYRKHHYLFQQLVKCGECSGVITWETQKRHVYGHCNHYRGCSQTVWFKEPDIEKQIVKVFDDLQIKNARIVEWIRKAIKDSHKDEVNYHTSSVDDLTKRLALIEKRFEAIYDDKVDERITMDFYNKKMMQYEEEKAQVLKALSKHTNANTKYYELASNIYELSQRAKEIYMRAKEKNDKRQLIKLIFANLTANGGKISHTYTRAFQLLSEAVKSTNSSNVIEKTKNKEKIFEPGEYTDTTLQSEHLYAQRPTWLARWDDYRKADWANITESPTLLAKEIGHMLQLRA